MAPETNGAREAVSLERRRGLASALLLAAVALALPAAAENWPGWRRDGSGVSTETGLPVTWSSESNVRWRTPLRGEGSSSPIVWEDRVFVTTAYAEERGHPLRGAALVVITVLCGLGLWSFLDGTLGDPLGRRGALRRGEQAGRRVLRKLALVVLFLLVGYGTIAVGERLHDRLQGVLSPRVSGLVFDKMWYFTSIEDEARARDVRTPASAFRVLRGVERPGGGIFIGSPRIPKFALYGGVLAAVAVLAANSLIRRRRGAGDDRPGDGAGERPASIRRLFGLGVRVLGLAASFRIHAVRSVGERLARWSAGLAMIAVGCAVLVLHSGAMADLPYRPRGNTWFLAGSIAVLCLVAFLLAAPARRWGRLAIVGIALLPVPYLALAAPDNPLQGVLATAMRARFPHLVALLLVVALAKLAAAAGPRDAAEGPRGAAVWLGAIAIALGGWSYFLTANYLLPGNVYVREVVSIDRRTGEPLWQTPCHAQAVVRELHPTNTLASPTPATDGRRVFAHFGDAGLFALDMEGSLLWHYEDPLPPPHWGAGSSPILWGDLVIMTYDGDHESLTVGIDQATGRERWRASRTGLIDPSQGYDAYSTPVVIEREGAPELVHQATKLLVGYDPLTGDQRWTFAHPGEQPVPTPVVWEDLIIVLGGDYGPYMGAIRIRPGDGGPEADEVWRAQQGLSKLPSPVVYGGQVYMVTSAGVASSLDARTGELVWRRRLPGAFWASVTAGDGKIYFCNASGVTTVVAAGPVYRELAVNELGEDVQASFAVARGGILIRTRRHLFHIGAG